MDHDSAWVAPLDVARIGPTSTPISVALTHVKRLTKTSDAPLLLVGDRAYGADAILRVVPQVEGAKVTWTTRLRSNLVFYLPPPPRQRGQKGAPRKYGARVQLNDPSTWPAPGWSATESSPDGERVELCGWADWRRREGVERWPIGTIPDHHSSSDAVPTCIGPTKGRLWAQLQEVTMAMRATGTFEVKLNPQPLAHDDAPSSLGRLSIDKQFHGDLEATSKGEMLSARTAVEGSAGYVAIERVSGTLNGRGGMFVLQHSGTMTRGAADLTITVVPDSGTGELAGLSGRMAILIEDGRHAYDFEYTLEAAS